VLVNESEAVTALRAAGCVFAEDEAAMLIRAAPDDHVLAAMVRRRAQGEPLEQVVGFADFAGVRVHLRPGVFVPRVRSELLVREAVRRTADRAVIVDLCCGSGALGLAVRRHRPAATLYATDIDPVAVACARDNLGEAGDVFQGHLFDPLPRGLEVDVLLANVPYVATGHIPFLPAEARDHEPRTALDGGPDGTDLQRRVAAGARHWLAPGGTLLIETSARQAPRTAAAVEAGGLHAEVVRDDERDATVVTGTVPARCVAERSRSAVTHAVTIRDGSVTW
jgi:release factor glutamine methyltransferase